MNFIGWLFFFLCVALVYLGAASVGLTYRAKAIITGKQTEDSWGFFLVGLAFDVALIGVVAMFFGR